VRPHPHINLACALPLGFTSQAEVIDAWLEEELPLEEVRAALEKAVPPGIQVLGIAEVPASAPTLQTVLEASEYQVALLEPVEGLEQRVEELLRAESLPRNRRGKDYDLRELILELHCITEDGQGRPRLEMLLRAKAGATGRPEEVLAALGASPEAARCHRTRLVFSLYDSPQGDLSQNDPAPEDQGQNDLASEGSASGGEET